MEFAQSVTITLTTTDNNAHRVILAQSVPLMDAYPAIKIWSWRTEHAFVEEKTLSIFKEFVVVASDFIYHISINPKAFARHVRSIV